MFLDTHAALFLHAGETGLFTETGRHLLEAEDLFLSPMAFLEMEYLYEIGRIRIGAKKIIEDLEADIGLRIMDKRWMDVTRAALDLTWTRDPFDRMIAAQALVEKQRLLSKDKAILGNCKLAVW
jgi:PIN domain nuclease of toxin-antitoxin system